MNEAEVTASERPTSKRPPKKSSPAKSSKSQPNPDLKAQVPFPGIESVMHGNGAVAHVMEHVCDGVIGYPITPSTEISEIYEAYRASGGINVRDRRPFFFEPEGEAFGTKRCDGCGIDRGKIHFQRLFEPGYPLWREVSEKSETLFWVVCEAGKKLRFFRGRISDPLPPKDNLS